MFCLEKKQGGGDPIGPPNNGASDSNKPFNHWVWIGPLIGVVVIGIVVFFVMRGGGDADAGDSDGAEESEEDSE